MPGSERREERPGCSADWDCRKWVAEGVRRMRRETVGWCEERARAMRGSLMVATEPVAPRRIWCLPSFAYLAAEKRG